MYSKVTHREEEGNASIIYSFLLIFLFNMNLLFVQLFLYLIITFLQNNVSEACYKETVVVSRAHVVDFMQMNVISSF